MKELIVISGKGGTGKTSIMAAFCSLAQKAVLCDADVSGTTAQIASPTRPLETRWQRRLHRLALRMDIV